MGWRWAIATCRGTSHIRDNSEGQDTSRCIRCGADGNVLVAVVSDGAGSAQFGKQGSVITCRIVSERAREYFSRSAELPTDEEIWNWIDQIRDSIFAYCEKSALVPRQFAATLVAVVATATRTLIAHIGDGAVVIQQGNEWAVPSWPAQG